MFDTLAFGIAAIASVATAAPQEPQRYDLVLRNGVLIDGVQRSSRPGDVAILSGRIAALGEVHATADTPVIEVGGRCICPGFVDVHAHVDTDIVRQPLAANFLRMGVTSLVTGNCGSSVGNIAAHLQRLDNGGIGLNYGTLVGHGTVRTAAMGTANRAPTAAELTAMQDLVETAMRAGAFGMSTGLIYVPGTYADRAEITALAKVVARHGGIYASHMRYEGDLVLDAIAETLTVARDANVPVHISHIKCTGKPNHGRAAEILATLQAARDHFQRVSADQYAYDASSTGIDVLFPSAELAVGRQAFARRLQDEPEYRERIHTALLRKMDEIGFGDFRHARIAAAKGNTDLNGLLLPAAAERRFGKADRDAQARLAIDLLIGAAPSRVTMVYHSMHEDDVERFLAQDWIALASDSGLRSEGSVDKPHPRGSGNTARLLARYVRERGVLDLPTAVHKMTSLPAALFGLTDRGELRVGAFADLVVFDPQTIRDRATYDDPTAPPDGIAWVLVNGLVAVVDGTLTGVRAGRVLRHEAPGAGR